MREKLELMLGVGLNTDADLFQVRMIIEPGIAAVAAENAAEDDLRGLEAAVASMDQVLQDAEQFIEADALFHLRLAKSTHNPLIPVLISPIVNLLTRQLKLHFLVDGGPERGQYHHKRILEAVLRRDALAAHQAMFAHLEQVKADSIAATQLDGGAAGLR